MANLAGAQGTPALKWNTLPGLTTWTLRCSGGPKKVKLTFRRKSKKPSPRIAFPLKATLLPQLTLKGRGFDSQPH